VPRVSDPHPFLADPDPDLETDPDPRPEFLRVKKYLKNYMHFFSSIFTNIKKIKNVFKKLVLFEKVK